VERDEWEEEPTRPEVPMSMAELVGTDDFEVTEGDAE
jgi:hypothetical protein